MTIPITLLFWIDASNLWSGQYQETIRHYHGQLAAWANLPRPYAYIRLTEAEKSLLPDVVDFCYDHDVQIIVEDGAQLLARGNRSDLLYALDRPEIQRQPYILHLKGDNRATPTAGSLSLLNLIVVAIGTLGTNYQVVSVAFPGLFAMKTEQPDNTYSAEPLVRYPAILRTRDLYLAAHLSQGKSVAPENILTALSHHPYRHLAFNTTAVTATR